MSVFLFDYIIQFRLLVAALVFYCKLTTTLKQPPQSNLLQPFITMMYLHYPNPGPLRSYKTYNSNRATEEGELTDFDKVPQNPIKLLVYMTTRP